jgi:hypothetical protein
LTPMINLGGLRQGIIEWTNMRASLSSRHVEQAILRR